MCPATPTGMETNVVGLPWGWKQNADVETHCKAITRVRPVAKKNLPATFFKSRFRDNAK